VACSPGCSPAKRTYRSGAPRNWPNCSAFRLVELLGGIDSWARTRDEIHAAVLREGWSDEAGAFTQYFGSHDLDAS
jgi:hypothetical protein